MRLIDVDEFAIEEPKIWDWSSVDGISSTAVLKQCIWDVQCAPTVEAIPVEWIKNWCKDEPYWTNLGLQLIDDWRLENESHISD